MGGTMMCPCPVPTLQTHTQSHTHSQLHTHKQTNQHTHTPNHDQQMIFKPTNFQVFRKSYVTPMAKRLNL